MSVFFFCMKSWCIFNYETFLLLLTEAVWLWSRGMFHQISLPPPPAQEEDARKRMHCFSWQTLFGRYPSWIFKMCWGWNTQDSNFSFTTGKGEDLFSSGLTFEPNVLVFFFPFLFVLQNFSALWKTKVHQETEWSLDIQSIQLSPVLISQVFIFLPSFIFISCISVWQS